MSCPMITLREAVKAKLLEEVSTAKDVIVIGSGKGAFLDSLIDCVFPIIAVEDVDYELVSLDQREQAHYSNPTVKVWIISDLETPLEQSDECMEIENSAFLILKGLTVVGFDPVAVIGRRKEEFIHGTGLSFRSLLVKADSTKAE